MNFPRHDFHILFSLNSQKYKCSILNTLVVIHQFEEEKNPIKLKKKNMLYFYASIPSLH